MDFSQERTPAYLTAELLGEVQWQLVCWIGKDGLTCLGRYWYTERGM